MDKTILIVEDDKQLMLAISGKLSHENYNIIKSFDGEEGLAIALEKHPDLILLDIVMPKMDGVTMLKKLREDPWGKTAKVIILTNLSEGSSINDELKQDVAGYFIKSDWRLEDIIKKIKDLI